MRDCPYCRSRHAPLMHHESKQPSPGYEVRCLNCGGRGPKRESSELAVAAWDKRPLEDELQDRLNNTIESYRSLRTETETLLRERDKAEEKLGEHVPEDVLLIIRRWRDAIAVRAEKHIGTPAEIIGLLLRGEVAKMDAWLDEQRQSKL